METLDTLTGEYPSAAPAVDAYIEECQCCGHTGLDLLSDLTSVKIVLSLSPARQVGIIRELLARFVVSERNGWVEGRLGSAYGYQLRPILSFILRKRLPLELSDLVALLDVISKLDGTYPTQYVPIKAVVNQIGRFIETNGFPGELQKALIAVRDQLNRGHYDGRLGKGKPTHDEADALKALEKLIGRQTAESAQQRLPVEPGEPWADRAIHDLQLAGSQRSAWVKLIWHGFGAESAKPSGKWMGLAKSLLAEITPEAFREKFLAWASLVGQPFNGTLIWKTYEVGGETGLVRDSSARILRGLVWAASTIQEPQIMLALGALAETCFKKVPQHGPRCPKLGNACLWALSQSRLAEAVAELSRLSGKARHASTRTMTERALNVAAQAAGQTREDLEEIAVPTHGLDADGSLRQKAGPFTLTISIDPSAVAQLTIADSEGKVRKSLPAELRSNYCTELKSMQRTLKSIQTALAAQRSRIELILRLPDRSWSIADWRTRHLDHPLVASIARGLIWTLHQGDRSTSAMWVGDGLVDVAGSAIARVEPSTRVRLWHPCNATVVEVQAWRAFLESRRITQPFKQAHREVYLLTDAERSTETYSNRFAAHIIRQHAFAALCTQRGWRYRLQGSWDGANTPTLELPSLGLAVEFWVEQISDGENEQTSGSGISLYLTTDQVRFYRKPAPARPSQMGQIAALERYTAGTVTQPQYAAELGGPLPVDQVPPQVFSEIMRDIDLFIAVCSVGNDPNWHNRDEPIGAYWHGYSFGDLSATAQTRKSILADLIGRLPIAHQCTLSDRFLIVRGTLRTYKIHLGSANILMEPNDQYLCIVPDQKKRKAGTVFLPFEGDSTLDLILSKAFLLASDQKISDPTIVRQIVG